MTYLPDFSVYSPKTLKEALEARGAEPMTPLAGGTDLMVYLHAGVMKPTTFLNLDRVAELAGPPRVNGALDLPALATYRDVRADARVAKTWPMLPRAAREVGVLAIQSRGTWVGNVVNASPAADGVPALAAYDAEVLIASSGGTRRVALADFYRGYKKMDLASNELVTGLHVPAPPSGRIEYYRKIGARRLQAISKTLLAGWLKKAKDGTIEDLRIVLGAVAPHTLRARRTEAALRGKPLTKEAIDAASKILQAEIAPIDDIRSNETYRRAVTENLLRDFLAPHARS